VVSLGCRDRRRYGRAYTPVAEDLGGTITVKVTGSKAGYRRPQDFSQHFHRYQGVLSAAVPTIDGTRKVGSI
jgi:hypothetical protein